MTTTYNVDGLDEDGCTVVRREAYNLKGAKQELRLMLTDDSYTDIVRVMVFNDETDECVIDQQVRS